MTDFLIQTSEPHTQLTIEKIGDHALSLHSNNRTMMLSTEMGEEIMKGLMAILKGGFTRAISETSLRLEEESTRRALPKGESSPSCSDSPSIPKPELDQL